MASSKSTVKAATGVVKGSAIKRVPRDRRSRRPQPPAVPIAGSIFFSDAPEGSKIKRIKINKAHTRVGHALFRHRYTPSWKQSTHGPSLMGLPTEVRDLIVSFLLPINLRVKKQPEDENIITIGLGPRDVGSAVPPILHTCRELRYRYGALVCRANVFMFEIPEYWSASRLTNFSVFAASVGVPDYELGIVVGSDAIPEPAQDHNVERTLTRMAKRWRNLKEWAKDVFHGVETRVLPVKEVQGQDYRYRPQAADWHGPRVKDYITGVRSTEAFISHVLRMAREGRYEGQSRSWSHVSVQLDSVWTLFSAIVHGDSRLYSAGMVRISGRTVDLARSKARIQAQKRLDVAPGPQVHHDSDR